MFTNECDKNGLSNYPTQIEWGFFVSCFSEVESYNITMPKKNPNLVAKKVRRKDGVLTTVYVKVNQDKKLQKKHKLQTLIKDYNKILSKLNTHIDANDDEKSLAALAIKMMIFTGIRVGNEESAKGFHSKIHKEEKRTYGLTTLDKTHLTVKGNSVVFDFIGKKQVPHHIEIDNPKLKEQILWAHQTTTDRLFGVEYKDIKRYLYNHLGKQYTPHDFRGLRANLEALKKISKINKRPKPKTKSEVNAEIKEVLDFVAKKLHNTAGVAKRSYIDSDIIKEHLHKRFNPKNKK